MQPVDNECLKALELRVENLAKNILNCSKDIQENNALLERIISLVDERFNFTTNKQKNQTIGGIKK